MDKVLELFKMDLGITHTMRDAYFKNYLDASKASLEAKGIVIDISKIDDMMLISDYAAWNYRNRNENVELSKNLQLRIRNRVVKERSAYVEPSI